MWDLEDLKHLSSKGGGSCSGTSLLAEEEQCARVFDGCDGYNQTVGVRYTGATVAGCGTGFCKGILGEESAG
jgi:hypothetical protein